MAISVTHSKVSAVSDTADTSLVRPSDWNAEHVVTGVQESTAFNDIGVISSGTATFNLDTALAQHIEAGGNFTFAFSNFPATGTVAEAILEIENGGLWTITWPVEITWLTEDGNPPDLSVSGTDLLSFYSRDAGTTIYGITGEGPTGPQGETGAQGEAGQSVGLHTLYISAAQMTSRVSSGAQATTRTINGITIPVLAFDTAADEGVNFNFSFPKKWNESTITYRVFWTVTGGGAGQTVQFELRGGAFVNDAAINTTGFGVAVAVTDTWLADNDVHVSVVSGDVQLANDAPDAMHFFELIRDVSDDTLGVDAELIGIEIFFTTDAETDD